jgi:hypothetical protein
MTCLNCDNVNISKGGEIHELQTDKKIALWIFDRVFHPQYLLFWKITRRLEYFINFIRIQAACLSFFNSAFTARPIFSIVYGFFT